MPGYAEKYLSLLGDYAMQYAGVKGFSKTVGLLRDLHLEAPLEQFDKFGSLLLNYKKICQEMHDMKDQTLTPQYEHIQQLEQNQASELRGMFPTFQHEIAMALTKIGQGFKIIEKRRDLLTSNTAAAREMINFLKKTDKVLAEKKHEIADRPIDMTLDEMRRLAGLRPVVRH